jgi:hypothetical protein
MPSKVPDSSAKAFRLWHVTRLNEFVRIVAEADTLEALSSVWKRREWLYQITHNGTPIDENGFPILRLPGQDLTKRE